VAVAARHSVGSSKRADGAPFCGPPDISESVFFSLNFNV
jgi:hypothetical protein